MKRNLLFSILLFQALLVGSQNLPCDGDRFSSRVFPSSTITSDILFGRNTTFMGVTKDLYMDIFQPTGDVAVKRPLFIFAFGGAFVSQDRTQLARVCDSLAGKGYVAVAIDYRLYDNPDSIPALIFNPNDGVDAVAKGMSDMKAAIRYFKRDAATTNTYRIDTASIFVGGISSGSMIALHTAYINTLSEVVPPFSNIIIANGGMEGNTDLPGSPLIGVYSFQGIRGVWNMSGALYDSGYIKAGDPALFSVHGSADEIVPYGYGRLFSGYTSFGPFACGSFSLNNQAIKVGVPTSFIPVIGGTHTGIYSDTPVVVQINATAPPFFRNILCPPILAVKGITLKGSVVNSHIVLSWQTLTETFNKGFAVEKQLPSGWTSQAEVHSKSVNGNSSLPLDYTFEDLKPGKGTNIYRVKTISLNGEIAYSNTIRVLWNDKSSNVFVIYPNPVGPVLNYKAALTGTKSTLKIYSSDMHLVQTNTLNVSQSVTVSGLARGLYLAVVVDGQNRQTASGWFVKK